MHDAFRRTGSPAISGDSEHNESADIAAVPN